MASALAQLFDSAQDVYFSCIGSLCKPDANIKLNGRTFKILKLLGEGGFAYVCPSTSSARCSGPYMTWLRLGRRLNFRPSVRAQEDPLSTRL